MQGLNFDIKLNVVSSFLDHYQKLDLCNALSDLFTYIADDVQLNLEVHEAPEEGRTAEYDAVAALPIPEHDKHPVLAPKRSALGGDVPSEEQPKTADDIIDDHVYPRFTYHDGYNQSFCDDLAKGEASSSSPSSHKRRYPVFRKRDGNPTPSPSEEPEPEDSKVINPDYSGVDVFCHLELIYTVKYEYPSEDDASDSHKKRGGGGGAALPTGEQTYVAHMTAKARYHGLGASEIIGIFFGVTGFCILVFLVWFVIMNRE